MPVKNRIDLTNIEGSMTNIIHNNADRLYTAQSVRELYNTLLSIFRENNLDTKASRTLLTRVIEKHTVKQGLDAIFNSYFCGANMGREKEKVGEKLTMFKFDEKLKKIVSEEIEKIEVETEDQEITVETEGDAVKVEIEPKTAECADCEIPTEETTVNVDDYAFFSDLDPETDIDDIPVDTEPDETENVEESLFKESAQGTYSMRMYDYIDEYLDNEGRKDLCYAFTKWLSDDEVHEFAKANDLVPVFEDEDDLYEGIEKKYVKPLKDKINACHTKQDLDEIGAYLDDFSDKDIDRILSGKVSNKDLNKMFGGYNFVDDDFPGWDFKESKSIKEGMNWTNGEEEYEIDSTLASAPINSIIFIKKSYGGKNRILKFEKVSTDKWDSLNKFNDRTGSYESDKSLKDKYIDGATWKLEKAVNESKSIKEALSVAEFIDWHETTNYKDNENTFEAVYSILDKYPESEDDVKAQYTAASDEDKEAISKIIDKANEIATEEPTVYLARAMHKMYADGYNYQEIADTLDAPVSLVIKLIGPDSYDESLTKSAKLKETYESNYGDEFDTPYGALYVARELTYHFVYDPETAEQLLARPECKNLEINEIMALEDLIADALEGANYHRELVKYVHDKFPYWKSIEISDSEAEKMDTLINSCDDDNQRIELLWQAINVGVLEFM